ncbi:Ldh family oxidoreductase [Cognatiyoonia sp.]|uniref:Ldh family oxidoreductase n=1 Tax=Cognatiyoonia sp. TaxID=2211652 RepID=UPI003F699745
MTDTVERIAIEDAIDLVRTAFQANGVREDDAQIVASALVHAEAEGQSGHGFSRIEDYISQVQSGKINAAAEVRTQLTNTTALRTDADGGFAFPALQEVIGKGVAVARANGTATMSVYNSHHCGVLASHVEQVAEQGLICMMVANAPKAIAPWGAKTPVFGTNPIAFAAPRQGKPPLVIDLSLSKVARGKVMNAKKLGKDIPEGWAIDVDGQPTTDAEAALAGSMLPIGDAKGTALALMVEVLATCFAGGTFSSEAGSFFKATGKQPRVGQFLMAISPEGSPDYFERIDQLLDSISALDGTRLPGQRRLEARTAAMKDGLLVPSHYLDSTRALCRATG